MRDGELGLGVRTDSERAEELSEPEVPLPWCSLCGSWGGTYSPTVAVAGNDCETFWDKDQLTDSCYQFNFQSTLSWREAWASCEQQGADLLSITEIHEQTYINGEVEGSLLWLSQKSGPCWGWGDTSSLRSAPAPTTRQDLDSSGVGGPRRAFLSDHSFYQGSSRATARHCGLALMTWTPVEVGSGQITHPSSTSTGRAVRHGDTPSPPRAWLSSTLLWMWEACFPIPSWNVPSALV